jgi:hypothetical protein
MKTNFGTTLNRNEMKNIRGGKMDGVLICTCGSTTNTTVCAFSTVAGGLNCLVAATNYCADNGGAANCSGHANV